MMQVITYSLQDGAARSDQYYRDIAAFVDEVMAKGEAQFTLLVSDLQCFLQETQRETPRTRQEYLYEFLTLGVLWRVYAAAALNLAEIPRRVLAGLARWRQDQAWLKPSVDRLRGVIGALFLSSDGHRAKVAPHLTIARLDKLLAWLAATGVFDEAVKRLNHWRDFLAAQSPEQANVHLAAALAFAAWFESRSAEALGRYTPRVEQFLSETLPHYRWRGDALFCARKRVEYHLSMVGIEILNRAYRESFLRTSRQVVLVPPCMRLQPEGQCQARASAFGAQCAHCSPGCRVHQLTLLGEKLGFRVYMLPDELSVFSSRTAQPASDGDLGIIGISCVLTNAPGGWQTQALGVPAQGVPLDYCGCSWHWHKTGIPTDVNVNQLLRVLGLGAQARVY